MPLNKPMFPAALKVPSNISINASTTPTMMLKSTKYQYSMRLDLPLNTAYFFNASRYQLNSKPSHPSVRAFLPVWQGHRSMLQQPEFLRTLTRRSSQGEVRRICLLRAWVNSLQRKQALGLAE